MEYVSNLCSPCPLHEQPKRRIYISRLCAIQLHVIVCLTALVLEESMCYHSEQFPNNAHYDHTLGHGSCG